MGNHLLFKHVSSETDMETIASNEVDNYRRAITDLREALTFFIMVLGVVGGLVGLGVPLALFTFGV